jgi:hypothetical protein
MAEDSFLWTTGGAGDGSATYTRSDWSKIIKVLAAMGGKGLGIANGLLNELSGSVTGANTVQIDTGAAVVDGKPYLNDAAVNVNIPSAVGGGNTRIDRIVLRANWTAQTVRITRIAGTDAASPTPPAITQTSETTYDLLLYQALVNTSGTVTLTDERSFAQVTSKGLEDGSITNAKLGSQAVDTSKLGTNSVTGIKILASTITGDKLADNAVDDTKAGDRVPQLYRRQGGSATNWTTQGSTTYTPGAVRMQVGSAITAGPITPGSVTITFPVAFSQPPVVIVVVWDDANGNATWSVASITASGCVIYTTPHTRKVFWLAIGPE